MGFEQIGKMRWLKVKVKGIRTVEKANGQEIQYIVSPLCNLYYEMNVTEEDLGEEVKE